MGIIATYGKIRPNSCLGRKKKMLRAAIRSMSRPLGNRLLTTTLHFVRPKREYSTSRAPELTEETTELYHRLKGGERSWGDWICPLSAAMVQHLTQPLHKTLLRCSQVENVTRGKVTAAGVRDKVFGHSQEYPFCQVSLPISATVLLPMLLRYTVLMFGKQINPASTWVSASVLATPIGEKIGRHTDKPASDGFCGELQAFSEFSTQHVPVCTTFVQDVPLLRVDGMSGLAPSAFIAGPHLPHWRDPGAAQELEDIQGQDTIRHIFRLQFGLKLPMDPQRDNRIQATARNLRLRATCDEG